MVTDRRFATIPAPFDDRDRQHIGESITQVVLRAPSWYFFVEKHLGNWGVHGHY